MTYAGPIIDAHHHLWDLGLGRHPWLAKSGAGIAALGDVAYMRRDYLVPDFLADAAGQGVVGSVHIEALWDRARPATEEVDWLRAQDRPPGIAARCVAWAPLADPAVDGVLAALADRPVVAGVRETVRWHPDPARRWAPAGLMDDPAWRRGAARLGRHGMLLELLMNPYQAGELARLAADLPGQVFVVNHCATPVDRDEAGLVRWRAALALMARQPNILIKISNQVGYAADPSQPAVTRLVRTILDAFGPARAMFGTDYPVQRRTATYARCCDSMRGALADLSADEQRAVFHDNAARVYGFPGG